MNSHNRQLSDELLSGFLDGELSPEERAAVEQRIDEDPRERAALAELRTLGESLAELPRLRVDPHFSARVLEKIAAAERKSEAEKSVRRGSVAVAEPGGSRPWLAVMAAVAAAVLLLLSLAPLAWLPDHSVAVSPAEAPAPLRGDETDLDGFWTSDDSDEGLDGLTDSVVASVSRLGDEFAWMGRWEGGLPDWLAQPSLQLVQLEVDPGSLSGARLAELDRLDFAIATVDERELALAEPALGGGGLSAGVRRDAGRGQGGSESSPEQPTAALVLVEAPPEQALARAFTVAQRLGVDGNQLVAALGRKEALRDSVGLVRLKSELAQLDQRVQNQRQLRRNAAKSFQQVEEAQESDAAEADPESPAAPEVPETFAPLAEIPQASEFGTPSSGGEGGRSFRRPVRPVDPRGKIHDGQNGPPPTSDGSAPTADSEPEIDPLEKKSSLPKPAAEPAPAPDGPGDRNWLIPRPQPAAPRSPSADETEPEADDAGEELADDSPVRKQKDRRPDEVAKAREEAEEKEETIRLLLILRRRS